MRAFSPYGLSKGLTAQVVSHWCTQYNIPLGKFLIANPFGPWEEPRFCAYLIKTWRAGQVAEVRTPSYLRDNIHVDLLALAYASFVKRTVATGRSERFGPMGYVETQGAFTERYARAMRPRLGLDCGVKLLEQTDFSEPLARINTHPIDTAALGWIEFKGLGRYCRLLSQRRSIATVSRAHRQGQFRKRFRITAQAATACLSHYSETPARGLPAWRLESLD